MFTVKCRECDAIAINGQACHEQGCPLSKLPWVKSGKYVVPDTTVLDYVSEGLGEDFDSRLESEEPEDWGRDDDSNWDGPC